MWMESKLTQHTLLILLDPTVQTQEGHSPQSHTCVQSDIIFGLSRAALSMQLTNKPLEDEKLMFGAEGLN